jgi:hypothetical protein
MDQPSQEKSHGFGRGISTREGTPEQGLRQGELLNQIRFCNAKCVLRLRRKESPERWPKPIIAMRQISEHAHSAWRINPERNGSGVN